MLTEQRITVATDTSLPPTGTPPPKPPPAKVPQLAQVVIDKVLADDPEYKRFCNGYTAQTGLVDYLFATEAEPHSPVEVFRRLRWGGLFVFCSRSKKRVAELAATFPASGFTIETAPTFVRKGWLPLFAPKVHYFVARKTELILPGQDTERFTYQVSLVRHDDPNDPIVVLKQVPTVESVVNRLKHRFPDVPVEVITKRARKFTEKIFPTFLTREAAILMILQEHVPAPYNARVPRAIDVEKDERGFVRKLKMNWLRNGGEPITQMEFARQSADLLRVMHDIARVIHLDLRLDNFVITPDGVGFVDFGSAVRDDEDLSKNPLLSNLFDELMRTSQIQRMLEQMTISGAVTSSAISRGYQKVDKAVDFFYLAVQFGSPHANPDLAGLIHYDKTSRDARDLAALTKEILRPADPQHPTFRSAKDILHGVERIMLRLDRRRR